MAAASCWPWAPAPSSCVNVNSAIPDPSRTPRATAAQAVTLTKRARPRLRPQRTTHSRRHRTRTWHGRCRSACSPMSEDKTLSEPHQEPHVPPETFQMFGVLCFGWNPTWNPSSVFFNKQRVFVRFTEPVVSHWHTVHTLLIKRRPMTVRIPSLWLIFCFNFFWRTFLRSLNISLQMSFHDNQWLHLCFFLFVYHFLPIHGPFPVFAHKLTIFTFLPTCESHGWDWLMSLWLTSWSYAPPTRTEPCRTRGLGSLWCHQDSISQSPSEWMKAFLFF